MFFIVGWGSRNCDHGTGYLYCPNCRTRKPAVHGVRKTYLTCFFIPLIPIAEHEGYYRCDGCEGVFDPDARWIYDFGDHASPKVWTCSTCRTANPSHSYRCQSCGGEG
jgi:hypothetical protein